MKKLISSLDSFTAIPPLFRSLITALAVSLLFSSFIYLSHWGIESKVINTAAGLLAIYLLLSISKRTVLFSGFFIGLLWFYWVGFSFQYYEMSWAIPLVSLGFALGYTLIFGLLALSDNVWIRAVMLFLVSYITPLDFNWLKPELLFLHSYLGIEKWQFALVLGVLASLIFFKDKPWRYALLILLTVPADYTQSKTYEMPLNIALVATDVKQEDKWKQANLIDQVNNNLNAVEQAIGQGKEMVILPESVFPLFMNQYPQLVEQLRQLSFHITIIAGALINEEGEIYNVTYCFNEGEVTIAKKVHLVPFGEYIPLPDFLRDWINQAVFKGSSDYKQADRPTDFHIKGHTFRNAICWEATCSQMYEDNPAFIIAISNNAWFLPSIEPTLQRLLIQFHAKKYDTVVFHVANGAGTGIVTP